ncbi:MAG: CNNM domain-containing protein [Bacteroidales bacterium]|jgi:CBS domain containing-hemolysin-like protein|nr:CNNM domain-containing protein [Bacteroidales bacterium]
MGLLFLYLILALAVSFLCSIAEAVLLSVSLSYVKTLDESKSSVKRLKRFKEDVDRPLSSILSLNTIAHTVGAAGVGAQATALFGEKYFGVVSAILTILILLLSEILPKSIGARYWRNLALPVAQVLNVMIYIMYPVVWISKGITKIISGGKNQEKVSREEIAALTEIGFEEGIFAETESQTIKNLIRSRSVKANEIMTPRTVVVAVEGNTKLSDFFSDTDVIRHSRFPVFNKSMDNVTGYVLKYDVTDHLNKGKGNLSVNDIKRPVVICYEKITVPKLFDIMLEKKEQIAVLVDEYGGLDGIVTLEDIIETIFGFEIVDELDSQADMQELAKEKWRTRAENMNIKLTDQNES